MALSSLGSPSCAVVLPATTGMLDAVVASGVSPIVVGRAEYLDRLTEALTGAQTGTPAALLIGGEAGVGKSRLVAEFTERASGRVLIGACLELGESGLPFGPFTTILRRLVREFGVTGLADLLSSRAIRELGRLLPELGEPAGSDNEAYQGEARARLFEQMLALLARLADAGPVTLVIEDAHWADRSTRDLLTFLIGNQPALAGVLVIVTFRSDELHRTHPLRPLLAELGRISWVERIELPRLTRQQAAAQIAAIVGDEPAPEVVDTVFRRSEGNPLFVEHLIGCDAGLPESLRDLVLASVQRLPEETRELLRVASVCGVRVGHRLVAQVSGLSEEELSRALRPAVAGNVLLADPDGYEFRHALIREVMREDLLPGERSRLHARYAEAIYADDSLVPAGRAAISLAYHWYGAHDMTWALIGAWQAAAEAGRALAPSEQLSMLSRVLELWDSVPDAADRIGADHIQVLQKAARVCLSTGDTDRGLAFVSSALQELPSETDPALAAWLLDHRSTLRSQRGLDGTGDDLREALRLVSDGHHERERAQVLASLAHHLHKENSDSESGRAAEESLRLAQASGDLATQSRALLTLAMLSGDAGPSGSNDALDQLARARQAAEEVQDHHLLLTAVINESHLLEGMGEHVRAAEVARSGLAQAERFGLSRTSGALLAVNVAEPLVAAGRWGEASGVIARAFDAPSTGVHQESLWVLAGHLALARGDFEAARQALARAGESLARRQYRHQSHLPYVRLRIAMLAATSDFGAALTAAQDSMSAHDLQASPRYGWPLLATAAQAAVDVLTLPAAARTEADAESAESVLEAVRIESAKLNAAGRVQLAHRATVSAELARIDASQDESRWRTVADAWGALGEPYAQCYALYRLAETALATAPDRALASSALSRAAAIAEDLGARPMADDIAILARRARISLVGSSTRLSADGAAERPHAGEPDRLGLTPREYEVLRLITAGQANAAIAAQLFISAKTVSVHVSNILAKLGVASRGEAAALAHRLRLFGEVQPTAPG
jgi:ATP/maltotriose-dependent transcriptional regulator MalT